MSMRIQELEEAIEGDFLYHSVFEFTTLRDILKSGKINPKIADHGRDMGRDYPVISLSRNQFYRYPDNRGIAQFAIDRDALKRSGNPAKPFGWWFWYNSNRGKPYKKSDEKEEEVLKPIPTRPPFIHHIEINPSIKTEQIPTEVIELAQKLGIPIKGMNAYKGQKAAKPHTWDTLFKQHNPTYWDKK